MHGLQIQNWWLLAGRLMDNLISVVKDVDASTFEISYFLHALGIKLVIRIVGVAHRKAQDVLRVLPHD